MILKYYIRRDSAKLVLCDLKAVHPAELCVASYCCGAIFSLVSLLDQTYRMVMGAAAAAAGAAGAPKNQS